MTKNSPEKNLRFTTIERYLRALHYQISGTINELGHTVSNAIGLTVPEIQQKTSYEMLYVNGKPERIRTTSFTLPDDVSPTQKRIDNLFGRFFENVSMPEDDYYDAQSWSVRRLSETRGLEVRQEEGHVIAVGDLPSDYQKHLTGELRHHGFSFLGTTALFTEVSRQN